MDGSSGDLRTGLTRQMIEIHEAMRLQIVVEHSIEVLTRIYTDQPPIQELVGNGWILLTAIIQHPIQTHPPTPHSLLSFDLADVLLKETS